MLERLNAEIGSLQQSPEPDPKNTQTEIIINDYIAVFKCKSFTNKICLSVIQIDFNWLFAVTAVWISVNERSFFQALFLILDVCVL